MALENGCSGSSTSCEEYNHVIQEGLPPFSCPAPLSKAAEHNTQTITLASRARGVRTLTNVMRNVTEGKQEHCVELW